MSGRINLDNMSDDFKSYIQGLDSQLEQNENYLKDVSINVKMFGAKGDGITDDTLAIQNAIDSGDIIYFPPGRYKITNTITLPDRLITVYGVKRHSVLMFESNVDIALKNVRRYSIFKNFDIHATHKCFQGSLSYCEFENIYITGNKSITTIFEDLDEVWCGFITFKNCTFLNGKCLFYSNNSINYVKFNDCTFQYMKYIICTAGCEVLSFNHSNFEFGEGGTIFTSRTSGSVNYISPSFNDCYIENCSILNMDIPALNDEPQTKTVVRNCRVIGGWVYNSIHLFNIKSDECSITYEDVSTITQTQTTELFKFTTDTSLWFKVGYASCRYKNDGVSTSNNPVNIISGTSRNVVVVNPTYKQWEFSNDVKFNNGIILGDTLPKNSSKGAIVYASDGNFKVTNSSNSIPIVALIHRQKTLADLKAITGLTDVCFGLATDTGELYYYNRTSWNKINFVSV